MSTEWHSIITAVFLKAFVAVKISNITAACSMSDSLWKSYYCKFCFQRRVSLALFGFGVVLWQVVSGSGSDFASAKHKLCFLWSYLQTKLLGLYNDLPTTFNVGVKLVLIESEGQWKVLKTWIMCTKGINSWVSINTLDWHTDRYSTIDILI